MTHRIVRRSCAAALICVAFCVAAAAQQQPQSLPDATDNRAPRVAVASPTNAQSNVNENFELNIAERRITERDFFASTAIETEEANAHGLSLRVGVAVGASEIDVLLRNVHGRVRFRGSLEALRRVLDARRPPAATTTAPPDVP